MICGAEACKLGAMIHGAELRVHFLKSFQKGSTCKNLSQKGLKSKKVGRGQGGSTQTLRCAAASVGWFRTWRALAARVWTILTTPEASTIDRPVRRSVGFGSVPLMR
jgi:hypothetical protein